MSSKGVPFSVALMGQEPWLVLPPSVLREVSSKSEDHVGIREVRLDLMAASYSYPNPKVMAPNFPHECVRLQLTRRLASVIDDVWDELDLAFTESWGLDTQTWKTVSLYSSTMNIIARTINRVFTETPELCEYTEHLSTLPGSLLITRLDRNEEFLRASGTYAHGVLRNAALINLLPTWLRTPIGMPLTYVNRRNLKICFKHCVPVIQRRIEHTIQKMKDESYEWEPPVRPQSLPPNIVLVSVMLIASSARCTSMVHRRFL
jgi:hypothetical protein